MFYDKIGLPSDQLHVKESELIVDCVQFVDHSSDLSILLQNTLLYQYERHLMSKWNTNIQNNLADDVFVWKVFIVEIQVRYKDVLIVRKTEELQ